MKSIAAIILVNLVCVEAKTLRTRNLQDGDNARSPYYVDRIGSWLNFDISNASLFSADHFIFSQPETSNYSAPTKSFYASPSKEEDAQFMCVPEQIPAIDSNCWNWNVDGVEYFGNQQKGCDNELCSAAVCACDPYCCDTSWDLSCRGFQINSLAKVDNYFADGCSASMLCCEPANAYPKPPLPTNPTPIRIIDMSNMTDSNSTCDAAGWSPPDDSTCWKWNSMEGNGGKLQKGCDFQQCQDLVCYCDPYCCQVSWDLSCRGFQMTDNGYYDNPFIPGCSASVLCCETDSSGPKPPVKYSSMLTRRR